MQKQNIEIGKKYVTKITTTLTVARVEKVHASGGWVVTDMETQKQHRIRTARRFVREANPAETGDKPKTTLDKIIVCRPKPDKPAKSSPKTKSKDIKLTPEFAYETWRENNSFPGLFIFEQPDSFIIFGKDAKHTVVVLKRQKQLVEKTFTFAGKKKLDYFLKIKQPEVFGVMKNISKTGYLVMLVTQKVVDGVKTKNYEISKYILAGTTKILDGLPPHEMPASKEKNHTRRGAPKKEPVIQQIDIKPGSTFKVRSGNEYQIQMVAESVVYAQQMRNGKPAGPTRPFDKKSLIKGQPKGLRDEESYYPKSEALEAAEKVLQNATGPMDAKSMIMEIRKRKLWFTTARTPHTTLAAAIARDIKRKGNNSKFQRVSRGMFELTNRPATKPAKKKAVKKAKKTPQKKK